MCGNCGSSHVKDDADPIDMLRMKASTTHTWQEAGYSWKELGKKVWVQLLGGGLVSASSTRCMSTLVALGRKKAVGLYFVVPEGKAKLQKKKERAMEWLGGSPQQHHHHPHHQHHQHGHKEHLPFFDQVVRWYKDLEFFLEIVFVCSAEKEQEFNHHFSHMPWLGVPFSDYTRRRGLITKFGMGEIQEPGLILLNFDGVMLATNPDEGRQVVAEYLEEKEKHDHPQPEDEKDSLDLAIEQLESPKKRKSTKMLDGF
eukprot:gnl/TRDRNA2_/TRDRNA2_199891_c0_seq1.p1 gnl/TRDRNA2_/TRDRNA2_199891_c0~~gnl/TRDRNA2_/TRDRNA2_199891_c0_seq1.p1  ORF type:complete len:256 (+),score=56.93 gnl/TRDRNA2_/TRDRNA2_199891_c0_seq1:89-856(+)